MDAIWYAADSPSKHQEVQISTYHSLTGNEWIDLLIVASSLLLLCLIVFWYVNRK